MISQITNTLNISEEEISGDKIILEYLQGNPTDFVISWSAYNPNLTIKGQQVEQGNGKILGYMGNMIPSNQVNFSQMERDSTALHNAMTWVRTITTLSIISLIIHQAWLILMTMLGVGTDIYIGKQEEKKQLEKQQERENKKNKAKGQ